MAYNYGHRQYQQIPDQYNLKPVGYAQTNQYSGGYGNSTYQQASPQPYSSFEGTELERLSTQDETLKYRIRLLRIISRVLATIISAATLAPLTMTLIKFIQTRDQVLTVDGEQRTAWAAGTRSWYTYLYFAISAVSFILNAAILISYCGGTKKANRASMISGWFHGFIMAGNIIVWIASVAIYRYGKIPQDGRFTDLWVCKEPVCNVASRRAGVLTTGRAGHAPLRPMRSRAK